MKLKGIIFSALCCMFALASCNKETPELEPSLKLDPAQTQFNVPATQNSITVKVLSTRKWKVSTSADWLNFSVNGKDIKDVAIDASTTPVSVEITVLPNDGLERSASVLFNGGTLASAEITITQEGNVSYKTVGELRALLGSSSKITVPDGFILKGTVISNSTLDNLTSKKSMYIQDETGGVNIYCTAEHSFAFGDEIAVDASGVSLELYKDAQELNGQSVDKMTKISSGNTVTPVVISIADLLANKYESRYVTVNDVQVADADLAKTWVVSSKATSIGIVAKTGESFVVRSSQYSSFGAEKVPQGSGKISGIATIYSGTIQIIFSQASDYASLTGERFKIAAKTTKIDEVITKTSGTYTVLGRVIAVSGFGFVINDGTQNNLAITLANSGVKIGDLVSVSGTANKWGTCIRLKDATVEATTEKVDETPSQEVTAVAPSDIASFDAKGSAKRISFEGTLSVTQSGENVYNNVLFDGLTQPEGSIYSSEDLSSMNGKRIKATGYYNGNTNSYFMMISSSVELDESDYFTVTPAKLDVAAKDGEATFSIDASASVPWTVSADDPANVTFSKSSGNGSETITVSVADNSTFDARNFTVTVSTTAAVTKQSYTITVAQAGAEDPQAQTVELTNAEIKSSLSAGSNTSDKYDAITFTSASGSWPANANTKKTLTYVQLRNNQGSYITSPEFSSNVQKVVISVNAGTTVRTFYCVPVATELPNTDKNNTYNKTGNESVIAGAYGSATCEDKKAQTITINFTGDTKQFKLIAYDGAVYIDSIKVYLKK